MTNDIQVIDPTSLTGAQVLAIRTDYGIGRADFARMCGYSGPSRITNIELHDSWKLGDREKIAEALARLQMNPPKGKHGRLKGESGTDRAARLDASLRTRGVHVEQADQANVIYDHSAEADDIVVPFVSDTPVLTPPPALVPPLPLSLSILEVNGERSLTNSEVGVWQRCRRKWWLAVYRKLVPNHDDYMGYRAIGNRVHRALAAWYVPDGQERTDPRDALERAIVEDWNAIATQARTHPSYVDDEQSLGDLSARYHDAVSLERTMVEGYVEWMIERGDDANLRVTASETAMSALIEGEVAGDPVRFNALALLDVRLTRVADGVRLFEDHKTVGNFAQKRKTLHMDPQMLHYHLLEWLNTAEGEARCDGALYNMLRRVKRTARAKEPFYDRVEVHHNAYEIDAYRRRLMGAARDIMRAERELNEGADHMSVVYPNSTDDCSWSCDFFAVCPMFDDGSRVEDAIAALFHQGDPLARYDRTRNEEV